MSDDLWKTLRKVKCPPTGKSPLIERLKNKTPPAEKFDIQEFLEGAGTTFFSGLNFDDDQRRLCPYCGDDYVHINRVDIYPNTDTGEGSPVRIDLDGYGQAVLRLQSPEHKPFRGGGVMITFYCEAKNHAWREIVAFHKGRTFAWSERAMSPPHPRSWGGDEEGRRIMEEEALEDALRDEAAWELEDALREDELNEEDRLAFEEAMERD
jgi:hypothetical protein